MAARSVWKGYIRFNLVIVPVKAYTATASGAGPVSLNQLHNECNSRIQYKKFCPIHGEVKGDAIVSGYEMAEGQYVVINPDELEKLRPANADKAINIAAFIKSDAIDPVYFSGKTHYLVPETSIGFKPYGLLYRTMQESKLGAFAQIVWHSREQIVLLRAVGGVLTMTQLAYANEIRLGSEFAAEVPKVEASAEELKLSKTLVEAMTESSFDLSQYKDTYADNLRKLIESKISGEQVVASPPSEEPGAVINLMEALQKSLERAKKGATAKPAKQVAPSTAGKAAAAARKRKTS